MFVTGFFVIFSLQAFSISVDCKQFKFTSGGRISGLDSELYGGTIFNRFSSEPKNYTIAYRYEADSLRGLPDFVEVNIDGVEDSSAKIEGGADPTGESVYVDVLINITNAIDLKSSIRIFGLNALGDFQKNDILRHSLNLITSGRTHETKRVAVCNIKSLEAVRRNENIGGIMKIGKRQLGDFLLHFQKVFVEPGNIREFPRHHFEFSDDNMNITEVTIKTSTRHITFNKKIWKSRTLFWATIYGLDKDKSFWAHLTIYGTK